MSERPDRPPIYMNRRKRGPWSKREKIRIAQGCSMAKRKDEVTLPKPPWEDGDADQKRT